MRILKNQALQGKHNKPILVDAFFIETGTVKPVLIFCHGYKGFKDWGAWNLMAEAFAKSGFCCVKFNFSHNGGTVEEPIDFPDLEAFGHNNYSKELDDLEIVIDWVFESNLFQNEIDVNQISLMGHSRGGGTVLIKGAEDTRVKKVITLAGVCDFKNRFPKKEDFKKWKEKGVYYVKNGRTHQEMPHFYHFYEDFKKNEKRLTIQKAVKNLVIPHLIIHGNSDTSVGIDEAQKLHSWNSKSRLEIIKNANHVFNTSHPWKEEKLSRELEIVTKQCIQFLE
ncbi:MAG: alpha/beta fold hydrolase [Polaribacter sp.]|nr:alpha/beta fold hydrolase [Polaribacter sp.]